MIRVLGQVSHFRKDWRGSLQDLLLLSLPCLSPGQDTYITVWS